MGFHSLDPAGHRPGSSREESPLSLVGRVRRAWEALRPLELDWIQVEVSALCQGACRYCPVHRLADRRMADLMTSATFRRLLPAFPNAGLAFLQGWGEPLLHPDFWDMARAAAEAGPRVGFTTGGMELDSENRRALLDSSVGILGVSLAGARSITHDRFRPGSPLEIVDRNLRALRSEKKDGPSAPPDLHLAYLLLADNLEELPEVVGLAEEWGAGQLVVSQLSLILDPEMEGQSLLARPDLWPWARELVEQARSRAREVGLPLHIHSFEVPTPGGLEDGDASPEEEVIEALPACSENVLRSCFVSASGDVSPCVMTNLGLREGIPATHRFRGRDVPVRTLIFGNVNEEPLEQIWQSGKARAFRRAFRDRIWRGTRGIEGLPNPCRNCPKILQG